MVHGDQRAAADGTPLDDVLLYDQDGRPLQVGFQEWWEDQCVRGLEQPRAADGVPVPNVYPQSYDVLGLDVDIHGAPGVAGPVRDHAAASRRPPARLPGRVWRRLRFALWQRSSR